MKKLNKTIFALAQSLLIGIVYGSVLIWFFGVIYEVPIVTIRKAYPLLLLGFTGVSVTIGLLFR